MSEAFASRRIFKSAVTSQNLIRELLQLMLLGELMAPGGARVWLVSPWISDVVILDNRAAGFNAVNPEWGAREIRLVEIAVQLMARGCPLGLATSLDKHNELFLDALTDAAAEAGVADKLSVVRRENLHTKGILLRRGLLTGSMNITYRGLELNDEAVTYDTTPQSLAQARISFESYLEASS
jgi:phosphatidylserine/phosphatidylglycerophosphate/cardiolipin synthase-like enzyme